MSQETPDTPNTEYTVSQIKTMRDTAAQSTTMNNAIMQAIVPYLPNQYHNVEHLCAIPHDIMNTACEKMRNAALADDSNELSTTDKERILNIMWAASGMGGFSNQLQTFMTSLDRYGKTNVTPVSEQVGYTFISRPRLCLQSSNIRNNRILTTLDTLNNSSMAFAIRCLLDSNFGLANDGQYRTEVATSPIFDEQNAFLVPLCNAVRGFSGSPDIDLEVTVTDGGYMSEAQSFAIGGSNLQRGNYNLTFNFQEVAYSPVMAILFYWIEYIRCVTRGSLLAYADDIDAQRLNYTVSIYRFIMDPTKRYITKYAKYTGCYPIGLPLGSVFNFGDGDVDVAASRNWSITFQCNKVEYMDYAILMDFNTLVSRYCPTINKAITKTQADNSVYERNQFVQSKDVEHISYNDKGEVSQGYQLKNPNLPIHPLTNFRGLPYIVSDKNGFRLEFRQHPSPAFGNQTVTLADQLLFLEMSNFIKAQLVDYATVTSLYTPEYYDKAKAYSNVDLGAFIREAFAQKSTADLMSPIR